MHGDVFTTVKAIAAAGVTVLVVKQNPRIRQAHPGNNIQRPAA